MAETVQESMLTRWYREPGDAGRRAGWRGRLARSAVVAATVAFLAGCYHLVMPAKPPRLSEEAAPLDIVPRRTIRLVNGYAERQTVWFRAEGIHHIGADLREWTDRLVTELQLELEPRGVSSLIATPDTPETVGPVLRVQVTTIVPPSLSTYAETPVTTEEADASEGSGPLLEATIESADGQYTAVFSSGVTAHGFSDALFDLKKSILTDESLAAWLRRGSPDEP